MTLLNNPGLPSCSNTDYLAGTSNPDFGAGTSNLDFCAGTSNSEPEYYTPNLVTVTQGLDNIDFHYTEPTQSHTPLSENFNENDVEDPTTDSFVNESDEASEPDEAEYPIPPEDGPDRVDINPTFYRSIPFFEQTFLEIPADSVDIPNLRYAKFYNKSDGRLDKGMLFKTKEELIEAVKDHSIRHARREYYVTESSKTKWKVLCKHSTEGHVKCNPSYGIKHVIQNVKDQIGYDVSYQKAWYSLKMAREIVYGTWESSVQKLPAYLGAIQKYNSGTIVEWKHKGFQASTGTALAFAVVDEETYPSWKWFLQQLSRHVIRGRRGMCLISDRHGGLIKAVREGPDFVSPHGVHRYCLRHVCSNFNSTIKNVVLKDLYWQAGSEYQLRKFNRIMEEIKKQDVKAFAYLDQINKEKWTASHDGGWRCGILTTNMSECINGVLKGARRLPVSALVEITLERTVLIFMCGRLRVKKYYKITNCGRISHARCSYLGNKKLLSTRSRNTVTLNSPRRSLPGAKVDMG
ncbi:UNVERIFIED_CONTAM: hypothetical protein Sradi_6578400 [Sesamum radiatum]|uniref:MULE transposase domain-containing protein n=1 Tax=Sesamum radiatum TaxID=300843 RepID=A0AAW2K043_SESRA